MTDPDRPVIESPRPTAWPLVLSLGLTLAAAGVAVGTVAFQAVGGVFFLVALWNWLSLLLPGRGTAAEPIDGTAAVVAARPGTVEPLRPGTEGYRFRLPEKVHPIRAGVKGGIAGGVVMLLVGLAGGAVTERGPWFPVYLRAGLALPGLDEMTPAELGEFRPTLFAVGLAVHAVMSVVIGVVYGVLLPTVPKHPVWQVVVGGLVLPLIWTGASAGMIGVVNPVAQQYVNWWWFAAAHVLYGLAAVAVIIPHEKVLVPPAGAAGPPAPQEGGRP